jgi:hypothetical protein
LQHQLADLAQTRGVDGDTVEGEIDLVDLALLVGVLGQQHIGDAHGDHKFCHSWRNAYPREGHGASKVSRQQRSLHHAEQSVLDHLLPGRRFFRKMSKRAGIL